MSKCAVVVLLASTVAVAEPKVKLFDRDRERLSVTVRDVFVMGGAYDVSRARKTLNGARRTVRACVLTVTDAQLLASKVANVVLELGGTGDVRSVSVSGLARDERAAVHSCIADALGKLTFAAPKNREAVELSVSLAVDGTYFIGYAHGGFDRVGDVSVFGREGGAWGGLGTIGIVGSGPNSAGSGHGGGRLVERRARSVKLETLTTAGDLHNAIVRRQLVRNLEKLEHCYEKERGATPTLEATARADFTIGKDGKVRTSTVRGTGHANLDACIDAVITRLEFPVPQRGEVVVTAPIVFKSGAF